MSDIPSFEPNWNLDDPNVIGQNADAFKTIQETLARIKLVKEVGLANLHEKGVLVKDPYCSVYDMVSAIKNIPYGNGISRLIPGRQDTLSHSMIKTSWDFSDLGGANIFTTEDEPIKFPKLQEKEEIHNPCVWYRHTDNFTNLEETLLEVTLNNEGEETVVIIISYLIAPEFLHNFQPYSFSFDDDEIKPTQLVFGTNGIRNSTNGLYSKVDIWYLKNSRMNCKVTIQVEKEHQIALDVFAKKDEKRIPTNRLIYSLIDSSSSVLASKKQTDLAFYILISDLNLASELCTFSPDEIRSMPLIFPGDIKKSKIAILYDNGELLNKYIQCEDRVHIYVPIFFTTEEG